MPLQQKTGLAHGGAASDSCYDPPNSHYCHLPGVLSSLQGLKHKFAAISSTPDDLTLLEETETGCER